MAFLQRTRHLVECVHLGYLGLLPALATYAVLSTYGHPALFPVFLGGTVAVAVYLAVVVSYTRLPGSPALALFVLVDGPLCALLAQLSEGGNLASFLMDTFLVDGTAVWLAIVWLALTTSRPTPGQRWLTLLSALAALGAVLSVFWPYLRESVTAAPARHLWLVLGIVEGLIARHYLLEADQVVRDEGTAAWYIGGLLFAWIAALIAGSVLPGLLR